MRGMLACMVGMGMMCHAVAAEGALSFLTAKELKVTLGDVAGETAGTVKELQVVKATPERRLVAAMEVPVPGGSKPYRSAILGVTLTGGEGLVCRPVVYLHEEGGAVWVRLGAPLAGGEEEVQLAFPPRSLRLLNYTSDDNGKLDWDKVRKIVIGFVADGQGRARLTVTRAELTQAEFRPTKPLALPILGASHWRIAADKAIKELGCEDWQQDGRGVRLHFKFPTGSHMYFVPSMPLPAADFGVYSKIRLTCRVRTPKPLGLLMMVNGAGGAYSGKPQRTKAGDWDVYELTLNELKGVSWAQGIAGKTLPPDSITAIVVGCHGVASKESDGKGEIIVRSLELIP